MIEQMPAGNISGDQIGQLSRDGFLVFDEFLDAATTAQLIAQTVAMEPDERSTRIRRGVAFARRNLLSLRFVRDLIFHDRVRQVLDTLAPDLFAMRGILFDKTGAANWTVPWHQDRSIAVQQRIDVSGFGPWSNKSGVIHVQPPVEILQRMLTLRFHLDPCGPDNGPLCVIAGTHHGILDQHAVDQCVAESNHSTCVTSAGGLLVMRPLLLHASSPASQPSHRRVIHIEFGPRQLPGGLQWAFA